MSESDITLHRDIEVCACVCGWERVIRDEERETEKETKRNRQRERGKHTESDGEKEGDRQMGLQRRRQRDRLGRSCSCSGCQVTSAERETSFHLGPLSTDFLTLTRRQAHHPERGKGVHAEGVLGCGRTDRCIQKCACVCM